MTRSACGHGDSVGKWTATATYPLMPSCVESWADMWVSRRRESGSRDPLSGKPWLEPVSDLSFSLSHADDLAVVALVRGRDVGVDVERLRRIDDAVGLARTHFTAQEADAVSAAPATARSATFLALWTRKESVVKALGGGLSIPLDAFEVLPDRSGWVTPPRDDSPATRFSIATSMSRPASWGQ